MIFGQTYMEFDDCHDNLKTDGHANHISKLQPLRVNRLVKTLKNPCAPPPPLYVRGLIMEYDD